MRELAPLSGLSRADWLEIRKTGIGSSDAAAVLGLNPWKSPLALWAEKTGLVAEEDLAEREYVKWGTLLEDPIATEYAAVTGRALARPEAIYRHERHEWMLCNPDRLIVGEARGLGVLEIKTAGAWAARGEWEEEAPLQYQAQIQHQMLVLGISFGSFAVLIGGQRFAWCDAERNERFCSFLVEREEEFWGRVQSGNPPDPDGSDSTRETLARLYPRETGEGIALPPEAVEWKRRRAALKLAEKKIKGAIDLYENRIKFQMGAAALGYFNDGSVMSWKYHKRAGYTVEPGDVRTLREVKVKL